LDYSGSGAEVDTTITIRVQDNDGNGEISGVYISIRDKNDGVVVDNTQVTDNTVIDENTLDFTYTYNPSDNLPDDNLGGFDVNVLVEDNYGGSDNNDWGGDGASLFTVDDYYVPIDVTPENAAMGVAWGYNITVSSAVTRVYGATSLDNSWVDDAIEGTFVAGASASATYLIDDSTPGDTVNITFRTWDSPLDGENTIPYTVTENRIYNWWLLYDENAQPYDLLDNWSYRFYMYYTDGTGDSVAISNNEGELVVHGEVYNIAVKADNALSNDYDYSRSLVPRQVRENLYFYLVGPNDITSIHEYIFTLEDYTGFYGPDKDGIVAFQKTPDNLCTITEDHWGVGPSVNVWLVQETRYQVVLYGGDRTRVLGYVWATSIYSRTLTVRPLTPENAIYIRDYLTWATWRDENTINVTYSDSYENTDNVTIEIYIKGTDDLQFQTTEYTDNIEVEWVSSENDLSYRIELTANHGTFGAIAEKKLVGPNLAAYQTDAPDVGNPVGAPIALLSILSVGILGLVGLTTGARYAPHGMIAAAGMATYLGLVGWLPIGWEVIGFLWTIAIVSYIGRSKG